MPAGNKKSNTFRKVFVKTPGGKTVVHHRTRKPKQHKCADCGAEIIGVPRLRPYEMHNLAKTKKRPQRAYGGKLCGACLKKKIVLESRS
ncbi:MAG: 50S ribosomal protein L34e [archaeon]